MIMDQSENNIPLLHDASGALKARDAALFVVGVGSGMDDPSVKKVASKNDYAFHATSFSQLMSVAPLLSEQICPLKGMLRRLFGAVSSLRELNFSLTFSFLLVQRLLGERFRKSFILAPFLCPNLLDHMGDDGTED